MSDNKSIYDDNLSRKVLYKEPIIIVPLKLADVPKVGASISFYAQFINDEEKRIAFSHKLREQYGPTATLILRSIFKNKNLINLSEFNVNTQDIMSLF